MLPIRSLHLSCMCLLVVGSSVFAQPAVEPPAVAAARKRQEALKTVEFVFSRTDVDMPASLGPRGPASANKPKKLIPEKETVVESKSNRVIFDGNRGRLENHHPMWSENTGELVHFVSTSTTQGTTAKNLIGTAGTIERDGGHGAIKHELFLPFTLICRPLDPQFCPTPLTDFEPTGRREAANGVVCDVYRTKEVGSQHREMWLDPKRNHIPIRYRHLIKGKVGMTGDIEYHSHPDVGWLPSRWKVMQYGHGAAQSLFRTSTIQIDSYQIGSEYSAEQFDLRFPVGAEVYDDRDKKMYQVQSNGDLREQLANGTVTGPSIPQDGWWTRYRWVIIPGIAMLIGASWLFLRRKNKGM